MKRRVRIITYAWGRSYIDNLLDITLAAVLAPGNLPALSEVFDCEFILLTEEALFERIEAHPVYRRLAGYAAARLIPIDDLLVAPLYGMTLTWATYRAMRDLGDAVTETDFLFFTADWIPADGSYRSLIPHLLNRERLIVAPSYCVISETVLPELRKRIDPETGVLAMAPREMAALGIPNRHNTIRGKTINSHVFHMDVVEQFYWLADPHTLLCHQMPIAIVAMRPERWHDDPDCFWDYGTVSELCPNVTPCVLADSDDFLMIELRSESTYDDGLRVGWPDIDTIGKKLAGFVTRDHTVYGRHQLVFHSQDLPPDIDKARASLKAFVDKVFTYFEGREVSHVGHPFWAFQSSLFDLGRAALAPGGTLAGDVLWSAASKALTTVINGALGGYEKGTRQRWDGLRQTTPSFRESGIEAYLAARNTTVESLGQQLALIEQAVKVEEAIHQRDVALAFKDIAELRATIAEESLAADYRYNKATGQAPVFTPVPAEVLDSPMPWPLAPLAGRLARVEHHHPMWAPMRHVLRALAAVLVRPDLNILWVTSDGLNRLANFTPLGGWAHTRLAAFTAASLEPGDMPWNAHFDLCVFELNLQDLKRLRRMYDHILPAMRPGGKAMVFHYNEGGGPFVADAASIRSIFPRCDYGHAYYTGSLASVLAIRLAQRIRGILPRRIPARWKYVRLITALLAMPAALKANRAEAAMPLEDCEMPPPHCTSLTIEIDV